MVRMFSFMWNRWNRTSRRVLCSCKLKYTIQCVLDNECLIIFTASFFYNVNLYGILTSEFELVLTIFTAVNQKTFNNPLFLQLRTRQTVDDEKCLKAKPYDTRPCEKPKCPPTWNVGEWRECEPSMGKCGRGFNYRDVECTRGTHVITDQFCDQV